MALLKLPLNLVVREPLKSVRPALLQGVGRVIVAHARLELALTELVYDLLRIDPKLGRQVLRGDNPSANYSILKRLFDLWGITPEVDFKKLKTDIEKACDKRNEVAHGVWVRMKGTDVRLQLVREKRQTEVGLLDRRILPQFAKRGVGALRQDAKFINGITAKVRTLQKQVLAELEPWVKVVPHKLPKSSSAKRKAKRA
jgi:hypothetical protein